MLTTKILSVLTLIFIPMANVSTVIASQDNKDDNTNMSDTLNHSGSLSKSNSFASDANSNSSFDDNAENETNSNIITSNTQQEPFVCDESDIESQDEEASLSENNSFGEMINAIDGHLSSTNTSNQH